MRALYLFTLAAMASGVAFAATIERNAEILDGDWMDPSSWVGENPPMETDNVRLANGTTTNLVDAGGVETTVVQISLIDSKLNIENSNFKSTNAPGFYHWGGEFNILGESVVNIKNYKMGNYDSANKVDVANTAALLNVSGTSKIIADEGTGFDFGSNAVNQNVEINVFEEGSISTGRIKLGYQNKDIIPTATSTLNVYGSGKVNISYFTLYKNAAFNASGNSQLNVKEFRFGDMTGATVASVNVSGNASAVATGASFIFNGTVANFSDNAIFSVAKRLSIGAKADGTEYGASANAATLHLKDSAKFFVDNNLVLYGGSTLILEGSNIGLVDGKSYHIKNLASSGNLRGTQSGTIKFIADKDGISTLILGDNMAFVDSTKQTGYALELDFSKFVGGETPYVVDIISNISTGLTNVSTIMQNYVDMQDELISVILANEGDTYSIELNEGGNGITLTYNYVPEPATYAAIFGVLALAFAVFRRRK